MSNASEYVANGASLLDSYMVGWEWKVDLDRLKSIRHPFDCVLNQLFKTYSLGLVKLGVEEESYRHGFCCDVFEDKEFVAAWHNEILVRRRRHLTEKENESCQNRESLVSTTSGE